MHEYSITRSIIEIIKENLKGKKFNEVIAVDFEIKKMSHIEPESIRFYYKFLTKDEEALKGAKLRFNEKGLKVRCKDCNKESVIEGTDFKCSFCSSKNVGFVEEDELRIISLDIE